MDPQARIRSLEAELARAEGKLLAVQEIGAAVGQALDEDSQLEILVTRVARILEAERATLFVLDDDLGKLRSRIPDASGIREVQVSVGQGLAGWVAQTGRSLNVKDAPQDIRFDSAWDQVAGFHTGATLCVPVKNHQGRTTGVLQVMNKRQGYFSVHDEGMLSALASPVALSLENSKLFLSVVGKNMQLIETQEELEQRARELDVLFEIVQVSASAPGLDDLLKGVLERAMGAVGAEAGSILLSDEDTGDLHFRCAVGGDADRIRRLTVGADEGICGHVATSGKSTIVNDVVKDARHSVQIASEVGYHPRSVICVPLQLDGRAGAMELLNKDQGRSEFDEDDLRFLSVIAGHVSSAIRLAQDREARAREERMSTIGQLLSSVVHDLRGPMTVIKGYTQLLRSEAEEDVRAKYCDAMVRQMDTIQAMASEVLAFARGDTEVLVRKVYLAPFFEELLQNLRATLTGKPVELQLDLKDRGTALFDEHKIRRAMHNLVRNAAQALGKTGGHITLHVDRDGSGALTLACEDDGPGVPEEIRDRVFESFTSHGKASGTGLGLAIVQKVAEDHGGRVEMHTRPGRTVFTLTIPQEALTVSVDKAVAGLQEVSA